MDMPQTLPSAPSAKPGRQVPEGGARPGLASLTGIRGVAAMLVMVYHMAQGATVDLGIKGAMGLYLVRDGYRAVDMFFILSGFILMYRHERDFRTLTASALRQFALARVFRIYPVHVFVLVLTLVLVLALPGFVAWSRASDPLAFSPAGFVQTLLLANRWLMPDLGTWNGPTWSLSLELLGYVAFPLLALQVGRVRSPLVAVGFAALMIALLVLEQEVTGTANSNKIGRIAIFRMATCFSAGIALCRVRSLLPPAGAGSWPPLLAALAALSMLPMLAFGPTRVLLPFAIGALILGISYQRGRVDAFLGSRPVYFLGEISYPFYLIHATMLDVLLWLYDAHRLPSGDGAMAVVALLYVAVAIGASTLVHRHVEKPSQAFGRTLLRRGRQVAV